MDRRTLAEFDAAIAELSSLALAGDVAGASTLVDKQIKLVSGSAFLSAQLQARLLHAAMDDPRMPSTLLAALIERFRWSETISALNRFHPDLHARVSARLAAAQQWLEDLKAASRRLDDSGAAARLTMRPPGRNIDPKTLSPGVLRALQAHINGAERYGPLLAGAIDLEAIERLGGAVRVEFPRSDPLAYVGFASPRLPDAARWAIALSAMYTIAQRGSDATLAPFAPPRPAQSLTILRDFWNIDGATPESRRKQTIERLGWLIQVGDRADPQCAEPGDPEAPIDLLAWDLARAAMTARHAYLAECVSESEAWAYLLTVAQKAQASFDSWRDYGERYRRGRIRWSNAQRDRFDAIMAFLIDDSRSPWRTLPWRLRVDEGAVRRPTIDSSDQDASLLARWRRLGGIRMQLAAIAAVAAIALVPIGWEAARQIRDPPAAAAQTAAVTTSAIPDPPDDPASAAGEFARIKVAFVANGAGERAQFRAPSVAHPIFDFRYGIDHAIPDRALTAKLLEMSIKGLPQALDLPAGAHFLTIQARLDTGAASPVRRFDLPADLVRPSR